jgi:8-oxo-dGTP diphosphatase
MTTKYVVGFAFDEQGKHLLLIRKNRPAWQRGLLNGVGGHIENESEHAAQTREFKEETGIETYESNWKKFAILSGKDYELHCFSLFSNEITYAKDMTDEKLNVYSVKDLPKLSTIPNLQWLIPAALHQHFWYPEMGIIREGNHETQ